ncbi:hypothetical protein Syun_026955 [Stephania yunnanensis]|uniref:DYW domain-containing protein n=1 Tax=Stephania yunnanensis TaxID=152371 RepID=A0AAP0EF09_9MAGN
MLKRLYTSWPEKISLFANNGQGHDGLIVFAKLHLSSFTITDFILSAVLKCCGRVSAIREGSQLHCIVIKHGYHRDNIVMTSLVDMYSKCDRIGNARQAFDEMPVRDAIAAGAMVFGLCQCGLTWEAATLFEEARFKDVALWNSLISGLFLNFEGEKALCYFRRMRLCGEKVDEITMVGVLSGCADMAALSNGRQVHGLVIKNGFGLYLPVGNALLDMYAKCGFMDDACVCFDSLPYKNVVSWTSLIMGFGKHGLGSSALEAFDRMEIEGYAPNKITFVGVLFACCHSGLVDEGWKCFNNMISRYSITPIMEHYTCMVDLLARAGFLEEAFEFIERMPVNPDARLLTALLSSCFYHKNTELTRNIGNKLLDLEPKEAGPYMLLSNFYGLLGDFEGVAKVRRLMHKRGIRKEKAYTWIEIDKRIHRFESGDRSHPLYKSIYAYLSELVAKMRTKGYVPNKSVVVQSVDEHAKEEILLGHSEKLAIALGLISMPPGSRITIVKNLRVCVDCHEAIRIISLIEGREIVARDHSRFHRFKNGECSCGNRW